MVVTKLDRLGCSLEHLIELSRTLQDRGVDLVVLDQGIDTCTAVGRMFFQILGGIAEFEHALMSERTRDGLAAARAPEADRRHDRANLSALTCGYAISVAFRASRATPNRQVSTCGASSAVGTVRS
ncbi:recombinase family protein [Nocardia sp. NPDC101769]|uniref:recombinase family protein n=1 Tax=Nocardia sp. NPDC101769 TaxID=3364333 RepID=UPI003819DD66